MQTDRFTIQNSDIRVEVKAKGAELVSLYHKKAGVEYMWSGNPDFWGKHSPVLFPIVGTLKNATYYYKNKAYHLSRHGFARDMVFDLSASSATELSFVLESDAFTLSQFPFEFRFHIIYRLLSDLLSVTYRVENTGADDMYFSVGGHPAFSVPFPGETSFDDYFLEFSQSEDAGRWPISSDGLIETTTEPILINSNRLALQKSLFYRDALVFKNLRSDRVRLRSGETDSAIEINFSGFPYLGVWSAKDADFVCIEPWCGIADSVNSSQQLTEKEGINLLVPGEVFERSWTVRLE